MMMKPCKWMISGLVLPNASLEGQMDNSDNSITNHVTLRRELPRICQKLFCELGSQQSEATYQECLKIDLLRAGVKEVHTEVNLPLTYKGIVVGNRRADMILDLPSCSERAILELKAVEKMWLMHRAQLEYYMHHAQIEQGYLINFPHDDNFPSVADKSRFEYQALCGGVNMVQHLVNNRSRLNLRNTPDMREVEVIHLVRKGILEEEDATKTDDISIPGSPLFERLNEQQEIRSEDTESLENKLKNMPF